jgi:hypothetical protein
MALILSRNSFSGANPLRTRTTQMSHFDIKTKQQQNKKRQGIVVRVCHGTRNVCKQLSNFLFGPFDGLTFLPKDRSHPVVQSS